MPRYSANPKRREYLLKRLRDADGPEYGDLVAEVAGAFPERTRYWTAAMAARSVRELLWDELAVVDGDGAVWLLSAGWAAAT